MKLPAANCGGISILKVEKNYRIRSLTPLQAAGNALTPEFMKRALLMDIFSAALAAVDPYEAVRNAVQREDNRLHVGGKSYDLDRFNRLLIVGAGKATARMALAAEESLGDRIDDGVIIVKYGHTAALRAIRQHEASHPVPDEEGVQGTDRILELIRRSDDATLILCLLSGGGSALLVAPADGITLGEKQRVTELLLNAGAAIQEMNAVRKHLSRVKGGRMAQAASPATVVTLALSDVIGDAFDVIASGPTAPDPTSFFDAAAVIKKYGLQKQLPARVAAFLERGLNGREADTAKAGDACFQRTKNVIIGGIALALSAARDSAVAAGLAPEIITSELQGEARDAARSLAAKALYARDMLKPGGRSCLLSGGETTVTVRGKGVGGRNQELALAFAGEIEGSSGITLLSAGTDGTDGATDAAGAIVDGVTMKRARRAGLDPADYLARNDSYSFFKQFDQLTGGESHVVTGPTGTNVMDIQIIYVERED